MSIRYISACAAWLLVVSGSFGMRAQEPQRGWDPPLETRPVLTVRTAGMSASIELQQNEFVGLVLTPGFRKLTEGVCVSSLSSGFDPTELERAAVAWHVEARLLELRQGEATIDLRWVRAVNRGDISPAGRFASEQRLVVRAGDVRMLDLVRTTAQAAPGCESLGLSYEVEFEGPRELSGAAIAYDLWLVQHDADGELVTDRYQVTARQGQQVEYFFRPVPYSADGRRAATEAAAIRMNVAGTIRGRLRSDGRIDLTVDGSRAFHNAADSAAVSNGGRTFLTVSPGETVEARIDPPLRADLSGFGDLNQVFGKHRTAIRVTATRLW